MLGFRSGPPAALQKTLRMARGCHIIQLHTRLRCQSSCARKSGCSGSEVLQVGPSSVFDHAVKRCTRAAIGDNWMLNSESKAAGTGGVSVR